MNKTTLFLLFFLMMVMRLPAQYKVTFNVSQEGSAKYDSLFIFGTFNGWDIGNPKFSLANTGPVKSITLDLPGDSIRYFFSHGKKNYSIENIKIGTDSARTAKINKDTSIQISIHHWLDDISYFKNLLRTNIPDTQKIWTTYVLGNYYTKYPETYNPDSALWCGYQLHSILQKLKMEHHNTAKTKEYSLMENQLRYGIAEILTAAGNFSEALQLRLEALHDMEVSGDHDYAYWQICDIANQYLYMKEYKEALKYCYRMKNIIQSGYQFKTGNWKIFFQITRPKHFI